MTMQQTETRKTRSPTETDRMVGARIRKLRVARGISLQRLAADIQLSHQQLQKYETGANRLSAGMLPIIADALGVHLLELFSDGVKASQTPRKKADKLREECVSLLRRTKSETVLRNMSRVLKALAD